MYSTKSLKYADGKIWTGVPNNIPNEPSVEAFKYAFKKLTFKQRNTHWRLKYYFWNILYYFNIFKNISFKFVTLIVLYVFYIITQDLIEKQFCWIWYLV